MRWPDNLRVCVFPSLENLVVSRFAISVLLLIAVASLRVNAANVSGPIHSVVTFGDSWSDAGSFGTIYGTTPGSSWSQLLARTYGDDQTPFLFAEKGKPTLILGGLDYAQGGSKTATPAKQGDAEESIPHSAAVQIRNHLRAFGRFRSDQLIVLWTGCNDILAPFGNSAEGPLSADQQILNSKEGPSSPVYAAAEASVRKAVQDELGLLRTLLENGAVHVAVVNIVDLGCQPNTTMTGVKLASRLTTLYNTSLAAGISDDARILFVDADAILVEAARDRSDRGFRHVTEDACANRSTVCGPADYVEKNANETYMFAGYGHLTQHTRRLLAAAVAKLVNGRWPSVPSH
jgi:phospholipase/lecithinase/hemolysin